MMNEQKISKTGWQTTLDVANEINAKTKAILNMVYLLEDYLVETKPDANGIEGIEGSVPFGGFLVDINKIQKETLENLNRISISLDRINAGNK